MAHARPIQPAAPTTEASVRYAHPQEAAAPGPRPPQLSGCGPFLLFHSRSRWDVRGEKVRPRLGMQRLDRGVNLIGKDAAGRWDLRDYRDWCHRRGRTIIEWDIDAPEYPSYMIRVAPGMYVDRWTTAYPGSSHVTYDEEGHCQWLDSLVERGVIEPPQLDVLEQLLRRLEAQLEGMGLRAGSLPEQYRTDTNDSRIRLAKQIDVVREAIRDLKTPRTAARGEYATGEDL